MRGKSQDQEAKMRAEGYLSVSEIAKACGITRAAIGGWVKRRTVEYIRVGRRVYVKRTSLLEYLGPNGSAILGIAQKSKRKK